MRFEFVFSADGVEILFRSSKEEVYLGSITFTDSDGESRPEIARLLHLALIGVESALIVIKGGPPEASEL